MARIEDIHLLRAFRHENELRGLLEPYARKPGDLEELLMETYVRVLAVGAVGFEGCSDTLTLASACARHCAPTIARKLAAAPISSLPGIEQAAAERLQQVEMNGCHEVHVELAAWLAQDPRHRVAFLRLSHARHRSCERQSAERFKPARASSCAASFARIGRLAGCLAAMLLLFNPCRGQASDGNDDVAYVPASEPEIRRVSLPRGAITLQFEHATLAQVIAEINRYSPECKVELADAELAKTPLGGGIIANSPDAFAAALGSLLKLRIERRGNVVLISQEMRTAAVP